MGENRVYVGKIPPFVTVKELEDCFSQFGACTVHQDNASRALVKFETKKCMYACLAADDPVIGGCTLTVVQDTGKQPLSPSSHPHPSSSSSSIAPVSPRLPPISFTTRSARQKEEEEQEGNRKVAVEGIPSDTTQEELSEFFWRWGAITDVDYTPYNTFGWITFVEASDAMNCVLKTPLTFRRRDRLEVTFSKPLKPQIASSSYEPIRVEANLDNVDNGNNSGGFEDLSDIDIESVDLNELSGSISRSGSGSGGDSNQHSERRGRSPLKEVIYEQKRERRRSQSLGRESNSNYVQRSRSRENNEQGRISGRRKRGRSRENEHEIERKVVGRNSESRSPRAQDVRFLFPTKKEREDERSFRDDRDNTNTSNTNTSNSNNHNNNQQQDMTDRVWKVESELNNISDDMRGDMRGEVWGGGGNSTSSSSSSSSYIDSDSGGRRQSDSCYSSSYGGSRPSSSGSNSRISGNGCSSSGSSSSSSDRRRSEIDSSSRGNTYVPSNSRNNSNSSSSSSSGGSMKDGFRGVDNGSRNSGSGVGDSGYGSGRSNRSFDGFSRVSSVSNDSNDRNHDSHRCSSSSSSSYSNDDREDRYRGEEEYGHRERDYDRTNFHTNNDFYEEENNDRYNNNSNNNRYDERSGSSDREDTRQRPPYFDARNRLETVNDPRVTRIWVVGFGQYDSNELIMEHFDKFGAIRGLFCGKSKGGVFAFITFETHEAMLRAIAQTYQAFHGRTLTVLAADENNKTKQRESERNARSAFVGHIPDHVTDEDIKRHFSRFVGNCDIFRPLSQLDGSKKFSYVYLRTQSSKAVDKLLSYPPSSHILGGVQLEVRRGTGAAGPARTSSGKTKTGVPLWANLNKLLPDVRDALSQSLAPKSFKTKSAPFRRTLPVKPSKYANRPIQLRDIRNARF